MTTLLQKNVTFTSRFLFVSTLKSNHPGLYFGNYLSNKYLQVTFENQESFKSHGGVNSHPTGKMLYKPTFYYYYFQFSRNYVEKLNT